MTTAPSGLIRKVTPNVPKVRSRDATSSAAGKNRLAMVTARKP
jgi:hypothetical protein